MPLSASLRPASTGALGGQALVARSTFGGGPGCAVCVCAETRAELIDCTLEATGMPTLYVMAEGTAQLVRGTVRGRFSTERLHPGRTATTGSTRPTRSTM